MQMNSQPTPSSRNGPAWWLAASLILISVLTYTPGSCLDREAILKGLRDRNVDTRRRTLESRELAACYSSDADEQSCPPNPELFRKINDELIRLLIDPDPSVRRIAAGYLSVSTDARAVQPLAHLLRDKDDGVRRSASGAFVHIAVSDPNVVRELEALLADRDKSVRKNAAMALSASGTHRSLAALRESLKREADADVRVVYDEALRQLEQRLK
jgi:hypothetical protein